MQKLLITGLLLGLPLLAGCGDFALPQADDSQELQVGAGSPGDATAGSQAGTYASQSLLSAIKAAPFVVQYYGVRRVTTNYPRSLDLDYREEVGSDGMGSFAIQPLEVLSSHPDPDDLLVRKSAQQAFDYRHRDFRVIDPALFENRYTLSIDSAPSQVLGRPCFHLTVPREAPFSGGHYEADVDQATSLVLSWKEFDSASNELCHVRFESFELNGDLSGMVLVDGFLTAQPLDIYTDLSVGAGFSVLQPSLPPTGFELYEATLLTTPAGDQWVRQMFTDGLERAWLLHGPPSSTSSTEADRVHTYASGAWTVAAGTIGGFQLMTTGKVPKKQLLDMLQSSL